MIFGPPNRDTIGLFLVIEILPFFIPLPLLELRRKRNRIDKIIDSSGNWVHEANEIADVVRKGFMKLFCTEKNNAIRNYWVLPSWSNVLSEEALFSLNHPISPEEIRDALWSIKPFKAPRPDGLHAGFYQNSWSIVRDFVEKVVFEAFQTSSIPDYLNQTLLVLIPKCQGPKSINHFRPISLCNTSYKIISKLIVQRLRPFLDQIISPFQSAFVLGRRGMDNMIIVQELIHTLSLKKGKSGFMAIKIDLEKAYDRLEWNFIRDMLNLFKFPPYLIKLILSCVSTTSISVLINGGKLDPFLPSRGLDRGTPFPHIFSSFVWKC